MVIENVLSLEYMEDVLINNGIDNDYLIENGGIEMGGDEWMDVVSEVIGRNVYDGELNEVENEKMEVFMKMMDVYFEKDWRW
jgi:hypothetical protein